MPEKEGLQPDYDSYSAVIKSYLKEAVCAYRQFSPSHPASRLRGTDGNWCHEYTLAAHTCTIGDHPDKSTPRGGTCTAGERDELHHELALDPEEADNLEFLDHEQPADALGSQQDPSANDSRQRSSSQAPSMLGNSIAPEYAHLPPEIATHLTRLKVQLQTDDVQHVQSGTPGFRFARQSCTDCRVVLCMQSRVNLECWTRVTELYEITVSKGMTLSPGLHYNMMRTAVLMANAGHMAALHFAKQSLDDMHHLGASSMQIMS